MRRVRALPASLVLSACALLRAPSDAPDAPTHLAARPNDPQPAELGSPSGSSLARPRWSATTGYAPTLSAGDAYQLFELAATDARPLPSLSGELLACRIDVDFREHKDWSLRPQRWADADMALFYGFGPDVGARSPLALRSTGANQSNVTWFLVPAVRMQQGDPIDVLVNDRDRLFDLDYIDRVQAAYPGVLPFTVRGKVAAIECRHVPPERLAEPLLERLWAVDDELVRWRRSTPGPDGEPALAGHALLEALEHAAALVGWDDPRIARRIGAAAAIEAAQARAAVQAFRARLPGLPAPGTWALVPEETVAVKVVAWTCDRPTIDATLPPGESLHDDERCLLTLELHNRGTEPLRFERYRLPLLDWSLSLRDADGNRLRRGHIMHAPGEWKLPPQATRITHVGVTDVVEPRTRQFAGEVAVTPGPPRLLELVQVNDRRRLRLALPPAP